jgi:hypothetical protein
MHPDAHLTTVFFDYLNDNRFKLLSLPTASVDPMHKAVIGSLLQRHLA